MIKISTEVLNITARALKMTTETSKKAIKTLEMTRTLKMTTGTPKRTIKTLKMTVCHPKVPKTFHVYLLSSR